MKILSTIACYGGNSNQYIREVSNELKKVSDVIIFSPETIDVGGITTEIRSRSLGESLVFEPRQYILDNIDHYDYFLYNEDDILIKKESIELAINLNEKISSVDIKNNIGFLRYEIQNDKIEYNDLHPAHSIHNGGNGRTDIIQEIQYIEGDSYIKLYNHHSGNFLISKKQLIYLLDNGFFETIPHKTYVGFLESGASSLNLYLNKITPISMINKLSVHHMSNKYVYNQRKVTLEEIHDIISKWKI